MSHHVVGIDLSLSHSGVTVIRDGSVIVRSVISKPTSEPSLLDRRNRIQNIVARILDIGLTGYDKEADEVPLFVIEAPLYRAPMRTDPNTGQRVPISGGGHAHDRAGLWWLLTHLLFKHGFVVEVSTTTLKRYISGTGSGKKLGVMANLPRAYPDLHIVDDNEADSLVLAAMGARELGHPIEPSPQRVTPGALESVQWPTNIERRNRP